MVFTADGGADYGGVVGEGEEGDDEVVGGDEGVERGGVDGDGEGGGAGEVEKGGGGVPRCWPGWKGVSKGGEEVKGDAPMVRWLLGSRRRQSMQGLATRPLPRMRILCWVMG